MKNKFIIFFVAFAVLFFAANIALADKYHHHDVPRETINNYIQQGVALAAASGQHNYKATNQLQWSVAGAFESGSSAASFGLAKQVGKVFVSGNFSSDGSDSIIGVSASGTF
jgi:hypothetical protein